MPELDLDDHDSVAEWLSYTQNLDDGAYVTICLAAKPGSRARWVPHVDVDVDGPYEPFWPDAA